MLTKWINQWNPFNIYGVEVGVEDLISNPLQPNETLMEDHYGHCRRIHVPNLHSTLWERAIFWFQTHLNEKNHLEAIDKLISLFYQNLLQYPPQETEKLQEFNLQIHQLISLKNDYGFIHLREGDPAFIDSRLKEIEQHAYSIFTYYHKQHAIEQEEMRKQTFLQFQEQVEQKFQNLALEHFSGLMKVRFLIMAPPEVLRLIVEERIESLSSRLQIIQDLYREIDEMERGYGGKFTIPFINNHFNFIRVRLNNEVYRIGIEWEVLIRSLILNYRLAPCKEKVKMLLDSIQVDPEELREGKSSAFLFREGLESEIERMKRMIGTSFA